MYSFNSALLYKHFTFRAIISLQAVQSYSHVHLGEELNKSSFRSDPNINFACHTVYVVTFI